MSLELTTATAAERHGMLQALMNGDINELTISSGSASWVFADGNIAKITLTENIGLATSSPPFGLSALLVKQDGTGGWDISWNSGWTIKGSLNAAANGDSVCIIMHFNEDFIGSAAPYVYIIPFDDP